MENTSIIESDTLGNNSLPSIVQYPFLKDKIESIMIVYDQQLQCLGGQWQCRAWVKFKNGNTKGEQYFIAKTFDEIVLQIKSFMDNDLK